jgi:hypothetical protein
MGRGLGRMLYLWIICMSLISVIVRISAEARWPPGAGGSFPGFQGKLNMSRETTEWRPKLNFPGSTVHLAGFTPSMKQDNNWIKVHVKQSLGAHYCGQQRCSLYDYILFSQGNSLWRLWGIDNRSGQNFPGCWFGGHKEQHFKN